MMFVNRASAQLCVSPWGPRILTGNGGGLWHPFVTLVQRSSLSWDFSLCRNYFNLVELTL